MSEGNAALLLFAVFKGLLLFVLPVGFAIRELVVLRRLKAERDASPAPEPESGAATASAQGPRRLEGQHRLHPRELEPVE